MNSQEPHCIVQSLKRARITCIRLFIIILPIIISADVRLMAQSDNARLRFDWPVGTIAHVQMKYLKVATTPKWTDTTIRASTFRLRVLDHPEGLLIRIDSVLFPVSLPSMTDGPPAVKIALLQYLNFVWPSFVVNEYGELIRIQGLEEMRPAIDSFLLPLFLKEGDRTSALVKLDTFLSLSSVNQTVSQEWNALIHDWPLTELGISGVYHYEEDWPSRYLPDVMLPVTGISTITKQTPCFAGDESQECVKLQRRISTDSVAVAESLRYFAEGMGGEFATALPKHVESTTIDVEATLIADPHTMLPYSLNDKRKVKMRLEGPSAQMRGEYSEEEFRTYRFTYE